MCGIAGLVGEDARAPRVQRMTDAIAHRGPDDSGLWQEPGVALGHRRLSIIDLSPAGHQPMVFGDLVITYNGEIYNFHELRATLPGPFHSNSDTEVLLHLYARDGDAFVTRLEGMYALAIWDRRRRRLFCARDRLGMKPFYWRLDHGTFGFASELKALVLEDRRPLDTSALRDYFTYNYIPAPKTIYEGIRKLEAAHTLVFENGRVRTARYWTADATIRQRDAQVAGEALDALLARVVTAHTLADVPVGVFLSGGIDSATLTYHLRRPKTFTLGFDVQGRSEAQAARDVATHLGTEHYETTASVVDVDAALEAMPRLFDEPFGDSAAWSNYLISQAARAHVTVALSGEGGDELFCGYPRYWKGTGEPSRIARLLAAVLPPLSPFGQSMQRRAWPGLEGYATRFGSFTRPQLAALVHPRLLEADYDPHWFYRNHWREDLDPIQRMRWLDLHTNLAEGLLTKVDRSSMAHSLEVRPPLLDHRLVEFALSLDPALLVDRRAGRGKGLLRTLMAPRLPPGHLERPKSGFGLPVRRWLKANPHLLALASGRLQDARVLRRPIPANFRRLWSLLVLDRWLAQQ
ncbi:MAG: asparagine synthase (glutamine-hydrolyzing) [Gammaproteobacteria bacterium]|nr:asparagine synthase (glutamine-hydrolyzing) [Gammaproteobacteria bacterium]